MRIRSASALGALVRDRRVAAHLSQTSLATMAGVSRRWLAALEAGKPGAELGLVLRTLTALDLELDASAVPMVPQGVDLDRVLSAFDHEDT